jgi:crotonobetainyl-CoA:carnitine CoA-transferase CaiB-like acyl-CoA transferase
VEEVVVFVVVVVVVVAVVELQVAILENQRGNHALNGSERRLRRAAGRVYPCRPYPCLPFEQTRTFVLFPDSPERSRQCLSSSFA